ncbi:hypothetical protein [Nakamurella deserti]|uniref:hypothetical protein n=1 Tax=Nakamurella deserti TaxID=2164074 RepID=UPI001300B660|nr:hypothetical protein [Nakamurella deserti]
MTGPAAEGPGWAMAPLDAAAAGFEARGSWLLEPDTGTGMLLYPRDWTFTERRDVTAHLRAGGWSVVPINRFLHLASDGTTAIRLLTRIDDAEVVTGIAAAVFALHRGEAGPDTIAADVREASV